MSRTSFLLSTQTKWEKQFWKRVYREISISEVPSNFLRFCSQLSRKIRCSIYLIREFYICFHFTLFPNLNKIPFKSSVNSICKLSKSPETSSSLLHFLIVIIYIYIYTIDFTGTSCHLIKEYRYIIQQCEKYLHYKLFSRLFFLDQKSFSFNSGDWISCLSFLFNLKSVSWHFFSLFT